MALPTDLEKVRRNTNTTTSDYSDAEVLSLIADGGVNCASAQIWQWKIGTLTAKVDGIKKSTGGVESHEFQSLKDSMETYKSMYEFYEQLCKDDNGIGTVLLKARPLSVAGIVTEEDVSELT